MVLGGVGVGLDRGTCLFQRFVHAIGAKQDFRIELAQQGQTRRTRRFDPTVCRHRRSGRPAPTTGYAGRPRPDRAGQAPRPGRSAPRPCSALPAASSNSALSTCSSCQSGPLFERPVHQLAESPSSAFCIKLAAPKQRELATGFGIHPGAVVRVSDDLQNLVLGFLHAGIVVGIQRQGKQRKPQRQFVRLIFRRQSQILTRFVRHAQARDTAPPCRPTARPSGAASNRQFRSPGSPVPPSIRRCSARPAVHGDEDVGLIEPQLRLVLRILKFLGNRLPHLHRFGGTNLGIEPR